MVRKTRVLDKRLNENKIVFPERFFRSADKKTIMGEVSFKDILFLEYRETEAGSNPREYNGLKKTNENILISLLRDHKKMFRFLHSGIIVSVVNPIISEDERTVEYDYCCLTNGNQTRCLILILTLLKLFFKNEELRGITRKEFNDFIKRELSEIPKAENVVPFLKHSRITELINYLLKNRKHRGRFDGMDLEEFLDSRISMRINLIDSIVDDLDDDLDVYSAGSFIAQANNDTQKVKVDDIFGNKYKRELEAKIFKDFITEFGDAVKIEYRSGEIAEKVEKVHILTLLRPVVATGILTKEKDIFRLTNQRDPIYKLFEKLIKKDKTEEKTGVVSKLIPLLYEIRTDYVKAKLEQHKRELIRQYKQRAVAGELEHTVISKEIEEVLSVDVELEKLVRKSVSYNVEHILPVVIFRVRNLIGKKGRNHKLKLNVPDDKMANFLETLTEVIYDRYVELKLKGVHLSLSSMVRGRDFYELGSEAYKTLQRSVHIEESDFIRCLSPLI